jgi:phosphate transport system substrate-binding protein
MKDMKVKPKKVSLRKLKEDAEAISPIVATLMLVLIAVAAASAFYIWESGWQNQQSEQLQNNDINSGNLIVSGSTTVNEFMNYAAPAFMEQNTAIKLTVDSVGSGAGLKALAAGSADIAMISNTVAGEDATFKANHPTTVETTIGYDAIAVIVSSKALTDHGLSAADLNMTKWIAQQVYGAQDTCDTWGELIVLMSGNTTTSTDAAPLNIHYRADASGTADAFATKYIGVDKFFATADFVADAAIAANNLIGSTGNTGMITDVAADGNAIGFTSYGMVSNSGGSVVASSYGSTVVTANQVDPTTATIKDGVNKVAGGYGVTRPLVLVTLGEPTGIVGQFVDFCKNSANNINFCKSTGYVSIYA